MVIAAIPPVFALGAWELVSRIPMRPQRSKFRTLVRALRPIATAGLFGGAAWLSYWHQKSAVLRYSNFDQSAANIIPLLIDGLMVVTSVSIFEVNERITELQTHLSGGRDISREPKPEPARPRRRATGRERVANILAKNPTIAVADLARLAEVSHAYAYTLAKELRSANGAELVDAS